LEGGKHVLRHSLVERAEIMGTMPEGVLAEKMMKVPVDELPVKTVVVGDEHGAMHSIDLHDPVAELGHHGLGIVELERLVAAEPTDLQGLRQPAFGDRLELAVERLAERRLDDDGPKAN